MHLLVRVSLHLALTLTSPFVAGIRRRHPRNLWTQISARTGEETHPYPILSLSSALVVDPLPLVMSQLQIRPQASVAFHPLCFFILIPFLLPAHPSIYLVTQIVIITGWSRRRVALSSSSFSGTKSSRKQLQLENPFLFVHL